MLSEKREMGKRGALARLCPDLLSREVLKLRKKDLFMTMAFGTSGGSLDKRH